MKSLCEELREARRDLNEERHDREEVVKSLARAGEESRHWKAKYEAETAAREQMLEEARQKWASKVNELSANLEAALSKCGSLELNKQHLKNELEDLGLGLERAIGNGVGLEKKLRQMERVAGEWQVKCAEREGELTRADKELREALAEAGRLGEEVARLELVDRTRLAEGRRLGGQVEELRGELEGRASACAELEACVRRLGAEKEELRVGLEGAETRMGAGEVRIAGLAVEVANARQEVERVGCEKDEEIKVSELSYLHFF